MNDLNLAWETWLMMRAAGALGLAVTLGRDGLLGYPEALFDDLLTIEAMYQRMKDK